MCRLRGEFMGNQRGTYKYKPGKSEYASKLCLRPVDQLERINDRKACPECYELSKKNKKCLSCDKEFKPGCKVKHICAYCFYRNSKEYEL